MTGPWVPELEPPRVEDVGAGALECGDVWVAFGPGAQLSGLAAFSLQEKCVWVECSERAVPGLSYGSQWQVCV